MESTSTIGKFLEQIYNYGNCRIYMPCNYSQNCNQVLDFYVDGKGKMHITQLLEVFDRPYWDGIEPDNSAALRETVKVAKYSQSDLRHIIALLVYGSFYNSDNYLIISHSTPFIGDIKPVVNYIYNLVKSMLTLSNSELSRWVRSEENSIKNSLIHKGSIDNFGGLIEPSKALENIETMKNEVSKRLVNVESAWEELQESKTKEYIEASQKWDTLVQDTKEPIYTFTKK